MGFLDRLLGRGNQSAAPLMPRGAASQPRSQDEIAVERYQYLLRTAPPDAIERVHTEAFAQLTEEQRNFLFEKLSENSNSAERPTDAAPSSLAKAATRAELQQPGSLQRAFGDQTTGQSLLSGSTGGPSFGSMVGSSILGSVAGYVIGSALVNTFMPPMDGGADASGADGAGAGDFGGGDLGGGGDFGGGDFGF